MENKDLTNPRITDGAEGGKHIVDGPITTGALNEVAPGLLRSEIDSRIVKICPMATPIDQISRMIGARPAQSMKVEYYSVDTKKPGAKTTAGGEITDGYGSDGVGIRLHTDNDMLFAVSETLLVPSVKVNVPDERGVKHEEPLVLYVREADKKGEGLLVTPVNALADTDLAGMVDIPAGTQIVRMGRAASELDVQTPQFGAVPVKNFNYCQIFKAQVEQSLYAKISAKEVGWTFSDQEEVAVMDMRLGMEKNFLFGTRMRLANSDTLDDVLFTGGIWNQARGEFAMKESMFTEAGLVKLMRAAFTGSAAGSSRKVLIGGAGFMERLNSIPFVRNVSAADKSTHWGIDFTEINSKFGSLYVVYSEIFDQCLHADDALIVDPAYLTKFVHVPFRIDRLDMQKTGARNTRALVATEASCVVLRHPKAHIKVTLGA